MSSQSTAKAGGAGGAKSGKDGSGGGAGDGGHHDSMSFLGATATPVNYIVGAGLLGIPGAMVKAGLVLSPIIIIVMGVVLNFTAALMTESLARAESLAKVAHITANRLKEKVGLHDTTEGDVAANPMSSSSSSSSSSAAEATSASPPYFT